MKRIRLATGLIACAFALLCRSGAAHEVELHVSDRWEECSMQLDSSLSQEAWRQFTQEAGIIAALDPLTSAKPFGRGSFDISLTPAVYPIDDTSSAWNDTFVHPHSTHWLYGDLPEEPGGVTQGHSDSRHSLALPLPRVRVGVTDRMDVGFYYIPAPGANYAFLGGHLQSNVLSDAKRGLNAAVRLRVAQLRNVEDFGVSTYALDVLASKDISIFSAYAGVSGYMARGHETTPTVDLDDETVFGMEGHVGASALLFSHLRLGAQLTVGRLTYPAITLAFAR